MSQYPDGFERAQARYEAMEDPRYYPPWDCAWCDDPITSEDDICGCDCAPHGEGHHKHHHEEARRRSAPRATAAGSTARPTIRSEPSPTTALSATAMASSPRSDMTNMTNKTNKPNKAKKYVIVRTHSAGIHFGVLAARKGREVTLTNARRIWRWRGANTLHELSLRGAHFTEFTRISEPIKTITLTEAIEVIPVTEAARENLSQSRWL